LTWAPTNTTDKQTNGLRHVRDVRSFRLSARWSLTLKTPDEPWTLNTGLEWTRVTNWRVWWLVKKNIRYFCFGNLATLVETLRNLPGL